MLYVCVWVLPRVLVVAVVMLPSPKFQVYVHISVSVELLFGSVLLSVNVTVNPLTLGINDATGE